MPASTPIARSKTAALARITDSIGKGYTRFMRGTVKAAKAEILAKKLHALYGVGCTPAQRITRKTKGIANALLVMYWLADAEQVDWLLLATAGTGLEAETNNLHDVTDSNRLTWLGYELVRHATHGRNAWTWRRPQSEMADLHNLLTHQLNMRHYSAVTNTLTCIARQPGFHGVREQSKKLCLYAKCKGYPGDLPFLFYVQKVHHGERLALHS